FIRLFKKKYSLKMFATDLINILLIAMVIYIVFNIFWGLNYDRKGIAYQLNLRITRYDSADLKKVQQVLLQKVNECKQVLINKQESYPDNNELFARAYSCYQQSAKPYPFLQYTNRSVKSSLYGRLGNYLGFTGYYNPFSGEAQLNTTIPK